MRVPWKFYEITHRKVSGAPTFNIVTGVVTETTQDSTVYGYIVPASSQDISRGFQVGSYKCFVIGIVSAPIVKQDKIIYNSVTYTVKTVKSWETTGLYELELIA